jgi:hypothetical protein
MTLSYKNRITPDAPSRLISNMINIDFRLLVRVSRDTTDCILFVPANFRKYSTMALEISSKSRRPGGWIRNFALQKDYSRCAYYCRNDEKIQHTREESNRNSPVKKFNCFLSVPYCYKYTYIHSSVCTHVYKYMYICARDHHGRVEEQQVSVPFLSTCLRPGSG